jgi:hypothetical protein
MYMIFVKYLPSNLRESILLTVGDNAVHAWVQKKFVEKMFTNQKKRT